MPKEFINPNWHVILIHYPLGVFMLGMLLEIVLLVFRHHGSIRTAARWMIVIGALSTLPAAYAGLYAMGDVVRRSAPSVTDDVPWRAVAAASTLTQYQWDMLKSHVWSNGGAAVLACLCVTIGVGCSNGMRKTLYPLFLLVLLAAAGGMARGAWYGGEMVYREGVAVKFPDKPEVQTTTTAAATTKPSARLEHYVNPLQAHVTLAGVAAAMGLLGIGLSMRAVATSPHWLDPELARTGLAPMPNPQRGGADDMAMIRSFLPSVQVTGEVENVPAGKFWLLTFLVAALASLCGWWVLGTEHQTFKPADLWTLVTTQGVTRRLAHVIAAASIIMLPLFMALLARFARRSRFMIGIFSMLLIAALAAQVWLGILLLLDQPHVSPGAGPWYKIQGSHATSS
jgi:uncharacterized membrane protein